VADEWVTQLLRQGDARVFKKYSQIEIADETRGSREAESQSKRFAEYQSDAPCGLLVEQDDVRF
jgi:hypothetical protein